MKRDGDEGVDGGEEFLVFVVRDFADDFGEAFGAHVFEAQNHAARDAVIAHGGGAVIPASHVVIAIDADGRGAAFDLDAAEFAFRVAPDVESAPAFVAKRIGVEAVFGAHWAGRGPEGVDQFLQG